MCLADRWWSLVPFLDATGTEDAINDDKSNMGSKTWPSGNVCGTQMSHGRPDSRECLACSGLVGGAQYVTLSPSWHDPLGPMVWYGHGSALCLMKALAACAGTWNHRQPLPCCRTSLNASSKSTFGTDNNAEHLPKLHLPMWMYMVPWTMATTGCGHHAACPAQFVICGTANGPGQLVGLWLWQQGRGQPPFDHDLGQGHGKPQTQV